MPFQEPRTIGLFQLGSHLISSPQRPPDSIKLDAAIIGHTAAIRQVSGLEQSPLRLYLLQEANNALGIGIVAGTGQRGCNQRSIARPHRAPRLAPPRDCHTVWATQYMKIEKC